MVGAIGFEPTTPGPRDQCATRLRHAPTHCRGVRLAGRRAPIKPKDRIATHPSATPSAARAISREAMTCLPALPLSAASTSSVATVAAGLMRAPAGRIGAAIRNSRPIAFSIGRCSLRSPPRKPGRTIVSDGKPRRSRASSSSPLVRG